MSTSDEEKLLDRALCVVDQQKHALKMCFDTGLHLDGLHCCANILRCMRTSDLSPKSYYELYIKVTEVLNIVEVHLSDEFTQGRMIPHLYEIGQYVNSVVPRLYLMVTIGVVYIRSGELPCKEILKDLVEMCRGVQHPLRGLFIRNYLLTSLRPNLLPDNKPANNPGGQAITEASVEDSVNFILLNFAEMNKLWVRMQHQGHTRDRERREAERRDLRVLVGANLHRISQLEMVTADMYKKTILPHVLEQVIQCNDVIAQEYLMDVIIQAFPDEFHVATLPQLLQACERLQPGVRLKPIIGSLVERLLNFTSKDGVREDSSDESQLKPVQSSTTAIFESLSAEIGALVGRRADLYQTVPCEARTGLPPEDIPGLFTPLLHMALTSQSTGSSVNQVLQSAASALAKLSTARIQGGSLLSRELVRLLHMPLYVSGTAPKSTMPSESTNALSIFSSGNHVPASKTVDAAVDAAQSDSIPSLPLRLPAFGRLFDLLDIPARRRLACVFLARAIELESQQPGSQRITSDDELEAVFSIIGVLIEPDPVMDLDSVGAEETSLLASIIHLVGGIGRAGCVRVPDTALVLLTKMRKRLASGGAQIIKATYPALVLESIQLLPIVYASRDNGTAPSEGDLVGNAQTRDWEVVCERVISFCHQSMTKLIASSAPDTALRLFLNCTLVIATTPFTKQPHFAYEFFSQAFTLFEQEFSDSRSQLPAFCLMVSTLCKMRTCLDGESYRVLRTQCSRAAFNLLLRSDQSRAVAVTAQLYAESEDERVDEGILTCLAKSRSLADMCMDLDARAQLYVDMLNYYMKYCDAVSSFDQIKSELENVLASTEKVMAELEFIPHSLAAYFALTKTKLSELLSDHHHE